MTYLGSLDKTDPVTRSRMGRLRTDLESLDWISSVSYSWYISNIKLANKITR